MWRGMGKVAVASVVYEPALAEVRAGRNRSSGRDLVACAEAAAGVPGKASALDVFGSPDDLKLRSSATLFASVSPAGSVFDRVLDRYFRAECDPATLRLFGE